MRAIAILAAASLVSGCTSTMLLEPRFTVSPYYATYQLRGEATVQTDPGGGAPLQDNPIQELSGFGLDTHEDDVGLRAEIGDGFGGLRFDYYRLDMTTSKNGILSDDWGELLEDDEVRMNAEMDELRISYVEPLFDATTTYRGEDLTFRFGAGAELAYRDLNMRAQTDDTLRHQSIQISGETISATARFRAQWMDLSFDVDYAISPHLAVRGDFGGIGQDIELRTSYAIPLRDVTFFAGYRYSTLEADGITDKVGYASELQIDGFQFGVTVSL